MITLGFEIEGEKQLARMLSVEIPNKLKVANKTFFNKAGELVISHSEKAFRSSGANIETAPKWKPLAKSTIIAKARRGYPAKPLIASGKLSGGMYKTVKPTSVTISNRYMDAYGKYHQSNQPRRVLPRRAFLEIDIKTRANIVRLLQTQIHNALQPWRRTVTALK